MHPKYSRNRKLQSRCLRCPGSAGLSINGTPSESVSHSLGYTLFSFTDTSQCFPQNHFLSTPVRQWLKEAEALQQNQIVLSRSSLACLCEENSHVFQELRTQSERGNLGRFYILLYLLFINFQPALCSMIIVVSICFSPYVRFSHLLLWNSELKWGQYCQGIYHLTQNVNSSKDDKPCSTTRF